MRKYLASVVVGALASLAIALPASAAGVCHGSGGAAGKPTSAGNSVFLRNTKTTGYAGTPFSFKVKLVQNRFPDTSIYRWYTFDRGYPHRAEVYGKVGKGAIVQVQTWCGGKRGADWNGRVYVK